MPAPGIRHDGADVRPQRPPAQHLCSLARIGHQRGRVTCASRAKNPRQRSTADGLDSVGHFADGGAMAGAQVEHVAGAAFGKVLQREQVGVSQVADVDVVAHGRTVSRVVIAALDREVVAGVGHTPNGKGYDMSLRLMTLANAPFGISAGSVEVAQRHISQAVGSVVVGQQAFNEQLAPAVGVDGVLRVAFVNGRLNRHAVGCAGAAEDDVAQVAGAHGGQHVQGAYGVGAVVISRLADRFAHVSQCRKVRHRVGLAGLHGAGEMVLVQDVTLHQGSPLHKVGPAAAEVVVDHHIPASFGEGFAAVAAHVTGTTGNKYRLTHAGFANGGQKRKLIIKVYP